MRRSVTNCGRLSLYLTTILCTGLAAPAWGQTAREHRNLDENGVDLTHGDYVVGVSEGSIGSADAELELIRRKLGIGGGNAHVGAGPHQWDGIYLQRSPIAGGGIRTTIIKDSRFESFDAFGTIATGSSLSRTGSTYYYRTSDGTTITFSDPANMSYGISTFCNGYTGQTYCVLPPSSITTPDGKKVTLGWGLWSVCRRPQQPFPVQPPDCSYWARLTSVSNSAGYRVTFSYASSGGGGTGSPPPPDSWQQRTGATFYNNKVGSSPVASTSYSYPSTGIVDVTDTAGRTWRFSGEFNRIKAIRRPGATSNTTTYSTAASGGVNTVVRDGATTTYSRSVSGNTATMTVTNALSQTSTIVSNLAIGRPSSVTNALGETVSYQYDSHGRRTQVTYPEGDKTVVAYDTRGNVTTTTYKAKPGSGLADIVTRASYPATCTDSLTCNSPVWTRDAKAKQTDYTYDPDHGGVLTVTGPADADGVRPQTRYSYTQEGSVYLLTGTSTCRSSASCTGTAGEAKTGTTYNDNLLPTTITSASGNGSLTATTTITYDAAGNIKTINGPLAGAADTTIYRYDGGRRLTGVVSPDPDGSGPRKRTAQRITYGNVGPTLQEIGVVNDGSDTAWAGFSSQEQVATTYDGHARPTKSVLKSGNATYAVTQTSYDALGHVTCTAQRMNPATFASVPANACTLGAAGTGSNAFGPDRIVRNYYDTAGRITKVQTAYGVTGLQTDEVTATYTDNGKTATVTDGEGNKTTYVYDGFDRLVKTRYPSPTSPGTSSTTDYEQFGYDANGNITSRRQRDGQTIAYAYDNLGRLVTKNLPGSEPTITYDYDLKGRPISASRSGHSLSFTYDALGRPLTQTGPLGTMTSTWDAAGRRTRLTWDDDFYVTYDYDTLGHMTRVRENGATSGVGVLARYTYDNLGNRISATYGNGTVSTWAPDPIGRLAQLVHNLGGSGSDLTKTFAYNPAGQIAGATANNNGYAWDGAVNVDRAYTGNGLNQYTAAGGVSLDYDARGNLITSGSDSYTYSSENMMASGPGGASMIYDPLMRLFQVSDGSAVTRFGYDGLAMTGEYSASGTLLRRYVHGAGTDEPIVWYEGTGTANRRWLHADERGSIIAVTNASGTVLAINSYDEYGIPSSGNLGRFQYTGQAWVDEIGLYHYKARMYSPTLGRFMQTDPIGYTDGLNLYNYVGSDPINFVDPLGLKRICTAIGYTDAEGNFVPTHHSCGDSGGGGSGGGSGGANIRARDGTNPGRNGPGLGPGGSGNGNQGPQKDDGPCRALRQNTDRTKGVLPDYITGNQNWNDVATLTGYRNLYQSSHESYSSATSFGAQGAVAVAAFACGLWGPCKAVEVGGTVAAGTFLSGYSLSALKDSTKAHVDALDARIQQLDFGC